MKPRQQPVLARLRGVHKAFGTQRALVGTDLEVRAGEVLALLGPNGAGKSTAIGMMLGLLAADAGTVELFGSSPRSLSARRQIGVMLQSSSIPEAYRIDELLEVTRGYYLQPLEIAECARLAGLDDLLDRRYGALSGGQQRRAQFALAICGKPRILFLDEPTTGLDIEARMALWQAIRMMVAEGCAVLLTTHYLEEAEALADRVAVLNEGRLVAEGSVEELRARIAHKLIRCVTHLEPSLIEGWQHVRSVVSTAGRTEIVADDAECVVRQLLAEDAGLAGLEIRRAGLAEAFVELTREAA